jgi:hypothetical protein
MQPNRPKLAARVLKSSLFIVAGLAFGYMDWNAWKNELAYSLEGRRVTAVVENVNLDKGDRGTAQVTYEADGKPVKAYLSAWAVNPKPGDRVPVLYRPDTPQIVRPDDWWLRYRTPLLFGIFPVLLLFFGVRFAWQDVRVLLSTVESPLSEDGCPVEPSGVLIEADTVLEVGSRVLAYDQDRWWRAEVVEVLPGDTVRIRFPGWDSTWDKTVVRSELQLDTRSRRD